MGEWTVGEEQRGARADMFLSNAMEVSRGEAQRLLEGGAARVNGATAKPSTKLKAGDVLTAEHMTPATANVVPEQIPLDIVYEDSDLLVVNKARGMVVHPGPGVESGTLVNAVLGHATDLSGIGGEIRPGIVHRLDKDTSGLLVVAKNDAAHISLQSQIQAKTAVRRYRALIWGLPKFQHATVDAPIGRHPADRKKMAVVTDPHQQARDAVTELFVQRAFGSVFCEVEAKLHTGRTHQIRVHCAYISHPVVGDPVYGGLRHVPAVAISTVNRARVEAAVEALGGQALHAFHLSFDHPRTGERMAFEAPLPPVLEEFIALLTEIYG